MRRIFAFLLGGVSASVILAVLYANLFSLPPVLDKYLKKFELQTVDYRMKFSKHPEVSEAVKIILVNDVNNLGDKLAAFTKFVSTTDNGRYKPKVIGFNFLFDSPTVNEEFIAATSAAGNVYYGYNFLLVAPEKPAAAINQDILPFRLEVTDIGNGLQKSLEAYDVQLPSTKYLATARGIGFVNTPADSIDNVCRRVPLFLNYQGNRYGSLGLLMAIAYLDIQSVDISFYPGQYLEIIQNDGGFVKIPVNRYGQMLIDFAYNPANGGVAPFETFSLEEFLAQADKIAQDPEASPLAKLKGAIVLVGTGNQAAPAVQPIPLAQTYPLIGIHANVINNLLTSHFAREVGLDFTVGIVVLLSMLTGFTIAERRILAKVLVTMLIAAMYALIAYGLFFQFRLLLPLLAPLLALGLTLGSVGVFVRARPKTLTAKAEPQAAPEKKRKAKTAADDISALENELIEIREELDRKSFRLQSKIGELRVLQEQGETGQYDQSGQIATLQKEIRAREIEINSLLMKEDESRRQVENLPFVDSNVAQIKENPEKLRRFFAKQGFLTTNERLLHTLQRVEKLSKTSVTLLIQGEPGVGKNLLAKIIKEFSGRHNRPLLEVICAGEMDLLEDDLFGHKRGAFPGAEEARNGYFKEIDGGTLVLEEIDRLSLEIQTRLMQAMRGKFIRPLGEDRGFPIDVRVVATTTQDLRKLVAAGKFREDLYHYFSVFPLYMPPLRERKEDLPLLARHFVQKYDRVHSKIIETVSDAALNVLLSHEWPGNVAELEKVIERAIAEVNPGVKELTEKHLTFVEADLDGGINDPGMLNYLIALLDPERELPPYQQLREKVLVELQRLYCERLLRSHQGNVKSAAIDTGLKEDTFRKMLSELLVDPENYRM